MKAPGAILLALCLALAACRPDASCDLETDTLSRDEAEAEGLHFYISNLEIGSEGTVGPDEDIPFAFDAERLAEAGPGAVVGVRVQRGPNQLDVLYGYPVLPERSGRVTGTLSGLTGATSGERFCGDLQLVPDPNVPRGAGEAEPLSNAVPIVLSVR